MTLEKLRIFIAVADYGGFIKAAQSLYISHSTTSRAVASLEEYLGLKLFERTSRSLRLTDAGRLLLEEGRALIERAHNLEERLRKCAANENNKDNRENAEETGS